MNGRKITLADGTEYQEGECGYADGVLWCYLPTAVNFTEAFLNFNDPEKTATITFTYGEMTDTHEGFTDLQAIMKTFDGKINVSLKKPTVTN